MKMAFVNRNSQPNPLTGREAIERLMESSLGYPWSSMWNQGSATATNVHSFAVDIYENADSYLVLATLPGANPDDVQITALNGTLSIVAELRPTVDNGFSALYREIPYGQYRREVRLPGDFALDKADATYEGGVLKLSLPKAEHMKPKSLKVKASGNA